MEYIQCPHCQKKYGVSEKLRAAVGKRIRCKQCQETFAIFIQESISEKTLKKIDEQQHQSEPVIEKPAQSEPVPEPEKTAEKDQNKKKKTSKSKKKRSKRKGSNKKPLNMQLIIMVVLATLLVVSAAGAYIYFFNPDLIRPAPESAKTEVPELSFKPIDPFSAIKPQPEMVNEMPDAEKVADDMSKDKLSTPSAAPAVEQPTAEADEKKSPAQSSAAVIKQERKQKSAVDGPDHPSQVCRDAAADYWIRTHMIANTMLTNEAYMKLLNQGISLTDEVRTRCKERELVGRLAEAAKSEQVPDWIKQEIVTRTSDKPKDNKASNSGF